MIQHITNQRPEEILEFCIEQNPEFPDVLARVKGTVPDSKRRISDYQAAALYAIVKQELPKQILEIGTAWGFSAAIMAQANPHAIITTLNPQDHEVEAAKIHLKGYQNIMVLCEKSWDYLDRLKSGKIDRRFDFIFVDGDHKRVRNDLPLWDYLNVGGTMFFHDYSPLGSYRSCPPVYEALNDFAQYLGKPFDFSIIDSGGVGMVGFKKTQPETAKQEAGQREFDLARAHSYSINSHGYLTILYELAKGIRNVPGIIVEVGVTNGGSAAAIYAGLRDEATNDRPMWLYDTFAGVPEPNPDYDGAKCFQKWESQPDGWCKGTQSQVKKVLKDLRISPKVVGITKGDINELDSSHFPSSAIAFLHIDATLYRTTLAALDKFWDQVSPGGIVAIAAYKHWQGVERATREFFSHNGIDPDDGRIVDVVHLILRK